MISLMSERSKVQVRANNIAVFVPSQKLSLLHTLLSKIIDTSESTKKGAKLICCFAGDYTEKVVNPKGMLSI